VKRGTVAIAVVHKSAVNGSKEAPFTIVGSGFCIDPSGLVVTCRHVVDAFMSKPSHQQIAEVDDAEKEKTLQRLGPVEVITPYALFYRFGHPRYLFVAPARVDSVVAKTDYDLALLKLWPHNAFGGVSPHYRSKTHATSAKAMKSRPAVSRWATISIDSFRV